MYLNLLHMKARLAIYSLLLILIGFTSCDTFKTKYNVSGMVTQNGEPVKNANVSVNKRSSTTNADGSFTLEDVVEGNHILNITKEVGTLKKTSNEAFMARSYEIEVSGDTSLNFLELPDPVFLEQISRRQNEHAILAWSRSNAEDFREYKIYKHGRPGLDENTGELIFTTTDVNDTTFKDNFELGADGYYYRAYVMNDYGRLGGSNVLYVSCKDEIIESNYTLELVNSIGIPHSTPVGIASDQENLWILCGAYNAEEHSLIYYNPYSYEIMRTLTFYNLIEKLGSGVYGVAVHDSSIWISTGANVNKLLEIDLETDTIVKTWAAPYGGPKDLDWDEGIIWMASGSGQIYKIDPENGSSDLFYSRYPERENAIAVRNDEVWVTDFIDNYGNITIYDKSNGDYKSTIVDALPDSHGAMCLHKGQLAVIADGNVRFYEIK